MTNFANTMPFSKLMGVEVVAATKERVTGTLLVRPDLCTSGGIIHGGAVMAFADALGAIGAYLMLPEGAKGTTTIFQFDILEGQISLNRSHTQII